LPHLIRSGLLEKNGGKLGGVSFNPRRRGLIS
jgi:hypothetical protein